MVHWHRRMQERFRHVTPLHPTPPGPNNPTGPQGVMATCEQMERSAAHHFLFLFLYVCGLATVKMGGSPKVTCSASTPEPSSDPNGARGILWTWAVALHGIEKVERYPSPIISASPYPSNFRRPKPRDGLLGRTGGGEASGRSSSPLRGNCSVVLDDTPSCPSNWPDLHMEPSNSTIARPITAKGWRQSQSAFEHFPHWPRLHA